MRSIQFKPLLVGLLLAVVGAFSAQTVNAQTRTQLVTYATSWKYEDLGSNLGVAWRAPGFNDTAWLSGPAALGYPANENLLGSATVQTPLRRYITGNSGPQVRTYYFRTRFNFPHSPQGVTLVSTNLVDDGAVFFLNGVEVGKVAMPAVVNFDTGSLRQDDISQHGRDVITFPASALVTGENVLAVELHQGGDTSSDVAFSMSLWATLPAPGPITIVTQPTNQTVSVGQSVTFHADVAGSPPYTFRWFKDGVAIPGATGQDYIIPSAALTDFGRYSFSVTNALGGLVSSNALLAITAPPIVLMPFNASWRYLLTTTSPGTSWRETNFVDTSWGVGPGPLGFETETIPIPVATSFASNNELTYYFRSKFVFTNNPNDVNLVFSNELDDGAVFYINNVEVLRVGMDNGPVNHTTVASRTVGNASIEVVSIPGTVLSVGTNTIAVEVHQVNRGSTDLVFGLGLTAVPLPPTQLTITNEPADAIFEDQHVFILSVGVSGGAPRYQWYKNNVLIPGATGSSYIIPFAVTNDSGLYHAVVANAVNQVQSRGATVLVVRDTNAPVLVSADGTQSDSTIYVTFSERVIPSLATNIANYTVSNTANSTLTINKAVLENGSNVVLTTTGSRSEGQNWLLFARNIRDISMATNLIAPHSVVPISWRILVLGYDYSWQYYDPYPGIDPLDQGTAWRLEGFDDSNWGSGPGAFIYDPSNNEYPYPRNTTLSQGSITKYFRRVFTYPASPAGAVVTIRHQVDDGAAFYVNGQEIYRYNLAAGADYLTPGTAVGAASLIATNFPGDILRAGDNLIAVELHGTATLDRDWVFGLELSSSVHSFSTGPIIITGGPESKTVGEGSDVTFTVGAVAAGSFQWYRNGVAIPGATNSTYRIQNVPISYSNSVFRVDANRTGTTSKTSTNAILRVLGDVAAPRLVSAFGSSNQVTVTFSERIDPTSGGLASNYAVTNRVGTVRMVTSAVVSSNTVVLTLSGAARIGDIVVVQGVRDLASQPNTITANSAVAVGFGTLILPWSAVWKYDQSGMDLDDEWRAVSFNDSAWPSGPGLLGFETATTTEPIRTSLANPQPAGFITTYYRTRFNFVGSAPGASFTLRHFLDDGAVFYLNGQEFFRVRMPEGTITYTTVALAPAVGDAVAEGPVTVALPNILVGENVLAVEVHQNAANSSDIVMGAELSFSGVDSVVLPEPPPSIFIVRLSPTQVRLSWSAPDYRLEEAASITGPWLTVVGATSPRIVTHSGTGIRFYRLAR